MRKKPTSDSIVIRKKVLLGVAPAIPIIAILLSKRQPGPLLLFLIGIAIGVIIGINLKGDQGVKSNKIP